jgi:sporulation protein YlmC with PRC-barrel domain
MELNRAICSRELKKTDVVGADGKKLGHIGDLTFTFDKELKLKQFILAGPAYEEFLEAIGFRPDKDPVFDASMIKSMDKVVYLSTKTEDLKTTLDDCAIGDDEIRLSHLEKLDIVDKKGEKIGKAVDVDFEVDGSASLIVGGGFVEEKMEALGLKSDVDIVVPGEVIQSIADKVQLKVNKSDLSLTLEEAVKKDKERVMRAAATNKLAFQRVRLYSERRF